MSEPTLGCVHGVIKAAGHFLERLTKPARGPSIRNAIALHRLNG